MTSSSALIACTFLVIASLMNTACDAIPEMRMYEGNGQTQDLVCTVQLSASGCHTMHSMGCSNDEARSARLIGAKAGTQIWVYDSVDCWGGDDYTIINVGKDLDQDIDLDTFEYSFLSDYINVEFHRHNGLDGKVSAVKINHY